MLKEISTFLQTLENDLWTVADSNHLKHSVIYDIIPRINVLQQALVIQEMLDAPTIDQVHVICLDFYKEEGNAAGGWLHIVLDDGNIEDGHIKHCIEDATRENDLYAIALGNLLLKLPYKDREKLIEMFWEY